MLHESNRRAVAGLEPAAIWGLFAGVSSIPRPSKKEGPVRAHVLDLAARNGLAAREDEAGNVVVDVPATPGRDSVSAVVLQAHLDMVCEKNADVAHDFETEGVRLVADRDRETGRAVVRAEGTTLGADNGLGVALALAAAFARDLEHGPLEVLLTVDEETGLTGAAALGPGSFRGRRLVNLDTEKDDTITIGCAGGSDEDVSWRVATEPAAPGEEIVRIAVAGLRGGHSGGDIHENRGNAIRLLARALRAVRDREPRIGSLSGGNKRNAIPREAEAVLAGAPGLARALEAAAEASRQASISESNESQAAFAVEREVRIGAAFASARDSSRIVAAILALPCGVLEVHPELPGLVRTSSNVSTVRSSLSDGALEIVVGSLSRGSNASALLDVQTRIGAVAELGGASVELGTSYPGWEPDLASPLLAAAKRVHREVLGTEPVLEAVHAGLECGIIGRQVGGLDAISIGPTVLGAHSPDERAFVDSVARSWRYLRALLEELSRQ